jgi:phage portal protein BeeE
MGVISNYVKQGGKDRAPEWRRAFGTSKEDGMPKPRNDAPPGGSWARSASVGAGPSQIRLVESLYAGAPSGWTDDRWEQTLRHYTGPNFVAISKICRQLSRAEFQVMVEDDMAEDGQRPVMKSDPPRGPRAELFQIFPYDLVTVLKRPNRQDSFGKWMYRVGQQRRLTGQALTWMLPDGTGTPRSLYCIPTAMMIPQPTVNPEFPEGWYRVQPIYPYGPFSTYPTPAYSVGAPVGKQWVIQMLDPHPLIRTEGYSTLTAMRLEMDEFNMMGRSRFYKMKNSIRPSGKVSFEGMEGAQPLPETEIDRMHAEWEGMHQGPENHGKLVICPPGGDLNEFGATVAEMDYPQSWEQMLSYLLGAWGITKPAAGMVEDSSYSTLFATMKQLNFITIDPELEDVASDLSHQLAPCFGDGISIKIRSGPINDHEIVFQKVDRLMQTGRLTWNQMVKMLDLQHLKTYEPWGSIPLAEVELQMQMQAEQMKMAMMMGMAPPQMAGAPGQGAPPGMPIPGAPNGQPPTDEQQASQASPHEVEQGRPSPGQLSQGSLGPRKGLADRARFKSIYDRVRGVCLNGSH